jgi:transcriptional regulator with XRE-family HTH domain
MHHYETGQRTPRADMLHRIGHALGVDPLTLLNPHTRLTLAILRARHGLLQADVAAHLTCGRAYYARIETGQANPNPTDRHRLATLLHVEVNHIDQAITDATTVAAALAAP